MAHGNISPHRDRRGGVRGEGCVWTLIFSSERSRPAGWHDAMFSLKATVTDGSALSTAAPKADYRLQWRDRAEFAPASRTVTIDTLRSVILVLSNGASRDARAPHPALPRIDQRGAKSGIPAG